MAHVRNRHLQKSLLHLAKVSPLVGLLGHRQVGKTTLLEGLAKRYLSLDDDQTLSAAENNPKEFLKELQAIGCAIDECQLSTKLFPALKERVRVDKRPGQFYLSGSIRFTSKKLIKESLTGRIVSLDLLPLTLSELDQTELPDLGIRALEARRFQDFPIEVLTTKEHLRRLGLAQLYLKQGGLPGVCFIRNEKIRDQKIRSQLETILDRDLRQIHPTTLTLTDLFRFTRALASYEGNPIHLQQTKLATGIAPITQKRLIYALESSFILRHLPIEGDHKGSVIIFEDQAEALYLAQNNISQEQQWIGLIYRNLREQFYYRIGLSTEFFQYRTRAGVVVPICIRSGDSCLGIIPILGDVDRRSKAAADSFLKKYSNSKVLFVTDLNQTTLINDRSMLIPLTRLLH